MKFEQLQRRIQRAEELLEGREQQVATQWCVLKRVWREGWTPVRIVVAGFGLGFLGGRTEPVAAINSVAAKLGGAPKLLQMISTVSGLFAALQAQDASDQAERAADQSQDAADASQPRQPDQAPSPARRVDAAGAEHAPPRPAEAATEMSERY